MKRRRPHLRRRTYEEPPALQRLHLLDGGLTATGEDVDEKPAKEHPHRRRRILFAVWTAAVVVAAGLLLLLVLPTRTWLNQRHAIESAQSRLDAIQAENARLQARVAALQTPEAVEGVARSEYNLAHPGEKVFSVLPAPALTNFPDGFPFTVVRDIVAVRAAHPMP